MTAETTTKPVYLSPLEVATRYRVTRSAIYHWLRHSDFPRPLKINGHSPRWRLADLEEWESRQAEG